MDALNRDNNENGLRIIKTAWDEESINLAVNNGFKPLIKKIEPSPEIRTKFSVAQNTSTGQIVVISDYRDDLGDDPFNPSDIKYETIIPWTFYYPYSFKSPFAAYLIPSDIKVNERVFLEDLIEDYVGSTWNQGDKYRLSSCEAIWNGADFEIQYNPEVNRADFIG